VRYVPGDIRTKSRSGETVYAADSKSAARKGLRVQVSSPAHAKSFAFLATRALTTNSAEKLPGTIWVLPTRGNARGRHV
jgi:hypothetical protein